MSEAQLALDEKLKVLLADYCGLRSDIAARMGHLTQVFGFGLVALSVLVSQLVELKSIFIVGLILTFVIRVMVEINREVVRAKRRMREIEEDVNFKAGEQLLTLESREGETRAKT
jgi:hypothetical protein